MSELKRCGWCGTEPLYIDYHDKEWGMPLYDDETLFEFLCLEGMQAGLSWITILKKRQSYREAFCNFKPQEIISFTESDVERLMLNKGIIRNRRKIEAIITNAKLYLELKKKQSFSDYLWQFVEGKPIVNHWKTLEEVPDNTELSDLMAKTLKKRGFKFVGTTICYAFMQATGMVNDHLVSCFRHKDCRW